MRFFGRFAHRFLSELESGGPNQNLLIELFFNCAILCIVLQTEQMHTNCKTVFHTLSSLYFWLSTISSVVFVLLFCCCFRKIFPLSSGKFRNKRNSPLRIEFAVVAKQFITMALLKYTSSLVVLLDFPRGAKITD